MFRLKDGILAFLWIINFTYVYPAPRLKDSRKLLGVRNKRQVDGGQLAPLPLRGHSSNYHNSNSGSVNERSRDYTGRGTTDYQYQYETGNGGRVGTGGYRATLLDGLDPNAQNNDTEQQTQQSQTNNGYVDDIDFQFRTFVQPNGDAHGTDDRYDHASQNQEQTNVSLTGDTGGSETHTQNQNVGAQGGNNNRYSAQQDRNRQLYPSYSRDQSNFQNTGGGGAYVGSRVNYENRGTYQTGNTNPGSGTRYYNTRTGSRVRNVGSGFPNSRRQYYGTGNYNSGGQFPVYNQRGYNQGGYLAGGNRQVPNFGVMSDDPNCPTHNFRIYINNMECPQAVDALGSFICYNYERVSQQCCQKCLSLKRRHNEGCEYGDRSYQCRNIEPFDCYVERNRHICCDQCRRYAMQRNRTISGCEYGDLTPRCQTVRDRKHLCYLPENQRLCCVTCPSLEDRQYPSCRWGDQNPDLCEPFTRQGALRINCYLPVVRQVCCSTCRRLRSRIDNRLPGCEYGDKPVRFNTVRGMLDCGNYIRFFGLEVCDIAEVNRYCCYTCHRYRTASRG